ncbi:hypothetical protein ILUMI_01918 [Ignelater luminosus]|uniref:Uncharacterized protein n=1 Tax=Ignelater luminosus TaxID=2038154 RepID=A0A8K0DDN2_IGNLU|nr:hypothetical protein ILUMI_01918 [Ignelater luminosus]
MWSVFLFCFVLKTIYHQTLGGFTNGAPCTIRNTALLDTRDSWLLPKDDLQCVDITSLGRRKNIPQNFEIIKATTLYADHMHLRRIPDSISTLMPKLKLIDFSSNNLRRISKDSFSSLIDLHTLLLEDNHVFIPKKTPLLNSRSLKALSLSNNKIRRLKPKTFKELKGLTVLYLDRNWLIRLHPKVFKPLKYLKYLHLGNNRLKVLPHIVLEVPKAIVIVKGNPFNGTEVIKR